MAPQKSPGEDAKTLDDSKDSAPNASTARIAKSNGPKPNEDETRARAYEIFQARHGGPGSAIGDWQKAEASASTVAPKAHASKADASKADEAEADGTTADAAKGAQTPADSGTI